MNTLDQLPRTPKDAGLIGVALKRKKEYANSHKHQLVNPEKMFRMLDKLKKNKNPHYRFYDDYNVHQDRCRTADPVGYEVVFNQDYDIIQDLEDIETVDDNPADEIPDDIPEENTDKPDKDEIEFMTKDPV